MRPGFALWSSSLWCSAPYIADLWALEAFVDARLALSLLTSWISTAQIPAADVAQKTAERPAFLRSSSWAGQEVLPAWVCRALFALATWQFKFWNDMLYIDVILYKLLTSYTQKKQALETQKKTSVYSKRYELTVRGYYWLCDFIAINLITGVSRFSWVTVLKATKLRQVTSLF